MTNQRRVSPTVALLLVVATVGCKVDRNGLTASLADTDYEALLDIPSAEQSTSVDNGHVALASARTTKPRIRTLESNESLDELIKEANGTVLVDFYADWCGPCKKQSKVLHDVEEYASTVDAQIIKVNVDKHRDLARTYKVGSLPTLLVLKDGQVSETKTGYTGRKQIEQMLR